LVGYVLKQTMQAMWQKGSFVCCKIDSWTQHFKVGTGFT